LLVGVGLAVLGEPPPATDAYGFSTTVRPDCRALPCGFGQKDGRYFILDGFAAALKR
jgi:hypothetical protein